MSMKWAGDPPQQRAWPPVRVCIWEGEHTVMQIIHIN